MRTFTGPASVRIIDTVFGTLRAGTEREVLPIRMYINRERFV